jgi:hypothetical protein
LAQLTEYRFARIREVAAGETVAGVVDPRLIDHAIGVELQIVDMVERSRRAQVQGDPAEEAVLDGELDGLYRELSDASTQVAVGDRPVEERRFAIEVGADDLDVVRGSDFDGRRAVLDREVAARGGEVLRPAGGRRYGARFCVRAPDLAAALDEGIGVFRQVTANAGLPRVPVVRVEAPTRAELGGSGSAGASEGRIG